jgi:2-polyprenyl-3-methyl-5-hydroxy-6-metoxy-1,4-benzoquinol methylase
MNPEIETRFENTRKSQTFHNLVSAFDLDKKMVLDIGCSYGEFLNNFGSGSVGITIAKEEIEYGKQRGLDVRYGNIESDNFILQEKFDVIFANNLLEHLYSPHNFLWKIKTYLKPNGMLILGVPCIPKIVSLLRTKKFQGSLAGAHINFFTRETLVKTVQRAGWKPATTRGFHFASKILDWLLTPIYPHFYVVATVEQNFQYPEKRQKELADRLAPTS